jgi:hypothetical protein
MQVTVTGGGVTADKVLEGAAYKDGMPSVMKGGLTIDDLSSRVIDAQSLQVDAVSGAALNTNAHLKAVKMLCCRRRCRGIDTFRDRDDAVNRLYNMVYFISRQKKPAEVFPAHVFYAAGLWKEVQPCVKEYFAFY